MPDTTKLTRVKIRIPLNVESSKIPRGVTRKVILCAEAINLEACVGLPITRNHRYCKFPNIDSAHIGTVTHASIQCDHLVLLGECDGPIDLACSWSATDVEVRSMRAPVWKVIKCRLTEIALVKPGKASFKNSTCEIVSGE